MTSAGAMRRWYERAGVRCGPHRVLGDELDRGQRFFPLIAEGRAGTAFDTATRLDAYRIYCDEGYHSLYSFEVAHQVAAASGIPPLPYDFAPYLQRLDQVGERPSLM
ncbi:hypothetical protein ACWGCW_25070 [Streptomyces sp. NPDC054933]